MNRTAPRRSFRLLSALALGTGVLLAASACAAPAATSTPTVSAAADELSGSITVYAAASLKTTFTALAEDFKEAHPGTTVELTFAGSSDLVTQLTNGAPGDVFASADEKNMAKLTDADLVEGDPVDFATNVLQIAVPPSNPAGVKTFADLARPGVKTVVCAPEVPCGAATVAVEDATGVALSPVSEESSVTDVLGKVTSGEADAGLVYVTDVIAAGDAVRGITFPESSKAVNTYPIAPLAGSANPTVAAAFAAYVVSAEGQRVLADAGFGAP
ncbi:molybdate ABC transporter substrate-binding protein [Plantibacter sp. VKM Ac-2885]|uniref:molybdate ABC transporter substrate-binding protein n=1 Tax=Plantibacter sp. VKM Ac-2885 TaxID=2783828 RepID=UPI001889DCB6|nr:molybdate ABC transporter substrate-binding protein [Plantibacter sp. VKM Ac-2885]MBF4512003.1 molybdate ABC transporter substrate-binding protein [Plantibacter sp. VKM Ac-2885]